MACLNQTEGYFILLTMDYRRTLLFLIILAVTHSSPCRVDIYFATYVHRKRMITGFVCLG